MATATSVPIQIETSEQETPNVLRAALIAGGLAALALVALVIATAHSADILANQSVFTSITKSQVVSQLQSLVTNLTNQARLAGITVAGLSGGTLAVMSAAGETGHHPRIKAVCWGCVALVVLGGLIN